MREREKRLREEGEREGKRLIEASERVRERGVRERKSERILKE